MNDRTQPVNDLNQPDPLTAALAQAAVNCIDRHTRLPRPQTAGAEAKQPTRADADRLAAEHATRYPDMTDFVTDGPLDEKTRRLYALREDGYTGPIDSDGYPVAADHPDAQTLARMQQTTAERRADDDCDEQ